jgi:spore coat protein JC
MWLYEKKLEFPVNIKNPNPALAKVIISQLGGADGEVGASLRYLSQRFSMPYREIAGLLTDIGTEELAHVEIVSTILYQLTRGLCIDEIKKYGFDTYFVDHTAGIYPQAASGVPFTAAALQSKGDIITDLNEDLAAEQKARTTYDNILRLTDDPDVREPIKFLRAREIVHYQRFAEALGIAQERSGCKTNYYITNPSFDTGCNPPCPEPRHYGESDDGGMCDVRIDPHGYRPYRRSSGIDHKRSF